MENLISDELVEVVYLYCYKRISDSEQAKDFAQEIILDALNVLHSGRVKENFYGYLWQMAHNKYVDFLNRKNVDVRTIDEIDKVNNENDFSSRSNPEKSLIEREEIARLYKSIELLSIAQRETVIRFYLRGQSISKISESLKIPEGTVKRRLFDARNQMRKFMGEMNENGSVDEIEKSKRDVSERASEKSDVGISGDSVYDPMEIDFICRGYAGCVFELREELKNFGQIAAACHFESKSVAEIADEIHDTVLNVETSVQKMTNATLLKKTADGKYLTDFGLIPDGIFKTMYLNQKKVTSDLQIEKKVVDTITELKNEILQSDCNVNQFSFEYLLWYFIGVTSHRVISPLLEEFSKATAQQKYPNYKEKNFGVFGEFFPLSKATPISEGTDFDINDDNNMVGICVIGTNFYYVDAPELTPKVEIHLCSPWLDVENLDPFFQEGRSSYISYENYHLFFDLLHNPEMEIKSEDEEKIAALLSQNLLVRSGKKLMPNFPIFSREVYEKLISILTEKLHPIIREFYDAVLPEIERIILPNLREDLRPMFYYRDLPMIYGLGKFIRDYSKENRLVEMPSDWETYTAGVVMIEG